MQMELNFMRFNGNAFGYCACETNVSSERRVKTLKLCSGKNVLQNFGRELRVVRGKGEIASPADEEMRRMRRIFALGDKGSLAMPGYPPFYAILTRLDFSAQGGDGAVCYEFEFYELPRESTGFEYLRHTASAGQNLWTIARIYGRTVEELVKLNPKIRRPDQVSEGEEVLVRWR